MQGLQHPEIAQSCWCVLPEAPRDAWPVTIQLGQTVGSVEGQVQLWRFQYRGGPQLCVVARLGPPPLESNLRIQIKFILNYWNVHMCQKAYIRPACLLSQWWCQIKFENWNKQLRPCRWLRTMDRVHVSQLLFHVAPAAIPWPATENLGGIAQEWWPCHFPHWERPVAIEWMLGQQC